MTPFYTSKGDSGDTGFLGAGRISKASARIEAVGSVDEATAALGLARSLTESDKIRTIILQVQKHLYLLMSELSSHPGVADQFDKIGDKEVTWLEEQIATLETSTTMPKEFIIPGESVASGALAVARTVVRRAERRAIALFEAKEIKKVVLITYLNRLSSLVFMMELCETLFSDQDLRLVKED
jgi:cob(I)alamin adenosyltransferase